MFKVIDSQFNLGSEMKRISLHMKEYFGFDFQKQFLKEKYKFLHYTNCPIKIERNTKAINDLNNLVGELLFQIYKIIKKIFIKLFKVEGSLDRSILFNARKSKLNLKNLYQKKKPILQKKVCRKFFTKILKGFKIKKQNNKILKNILVKSSDRIIYKTKNSHRSQRSIKKKKNFFNHKNQLRFLLVKERKNKPIFKRFNIKKSLNNF